MVATSVADAFVMAFFEWLLGILARFSDARHTAPRFRFSPNTMESVARQTKTTDPTKKIKSVPLICPLVALSGQKSWTTLLRSQTELDQWSASSKDRDYMLSRPATDRKSLQPGASRGTRLCVGYAQLSMAFSGSCLKFRPSSAMPPSPLRFWKRRSDTSSTPYRWAPSA